MPPPTLRARGDVVSGPDLRSQLRVEQRESELIEELWHAFVAQRAELDLALASIGGAKCLIDVPGVASEFDQVAIARAKDALEPLDGDLLGVRASIPVAVVRGHVFGVAVLS